MSDIALIVSEQQAGSKVLPVWREVLTAYLQTLDSARTRRVYGRTVEHAMSELGTLDAISPSGLTAYRETLTRRLDTGSDRLAPSSVALAFAALRGFLRFARLTGQLQISTETITFCLKSPGAKVIKPYQVLSDGETRRLLDALAPGRDRCLIALLLGTGLRVSELCNVKVGDITPDDDSDLLLRVRQGKGRKDRIVPLPRGTADEIRTYLASTSRNLADKRDDDTWLFISRKQGGPLGTEQARRLLKAYCTRAGVTDKAISPHSLRHGYAIGLLRDGAPIGAVQKLLGHASLSTTQRYTDHLELDELKAVVQRRGKVAG